MDDFGKFYYGFEVEEKEPIQLYCSFYDLFVQFVAGTPIKRKDWGGYWKYNEGNIYIFTKTGEVINLRNSEDIIFTLSHLGMHDWEIATDKNCSIKVK